MVVRRNTQRDGGMKSGVVECEKERYDNVSGTYITYTSVIEHRLMHLSSNIRLNLEKTTLNKYPTNSCSSRNALSVINAVWLDEREWAKQNMHSVFWL
jgi:hypothetical protein